jgi:hypothetical protein
VGGEENGDLLQNCVRGELNSYARFWELRIRWLIEKEGDDSIDRIDNCERLRLIWVLAMSQSRG